MGFNVTDLTGPEIERLVAAIEALGTLESAISALTPGLVTTAQRGMLAPDAEAIANGFIKEATSSNKGLMSKAFAALLTNPEALVFTKGKSLTQNAGFHNSLYRGKSLGSTVTAAQYAAISAGTFDDLFIGDYWTINGVNWRIAAFDYWYNHGDTACTTHHVVIVPDSNLASCKMNDTNITTGGYIGSDYYTGNNSNNGKATAQSAINNAFGSSHILTHREYLTNAVTNGYPSAGAWYDSTFELLNEPMVYGSGFFTPRNSLGATIPNTHTIDTSQLPLFQHDHSRICNRATWWLRDVASAASFADVNYSGACDYYNASNSFGVRPAFGIRA